MDIEFKKRPFGDTVLAIGPFIGPELDRWAPALEIMVSGPEPPRKIWISEDSDFWIDAVDTDPHPFRVYFGFDKNHKSKWRQALQKELEDMIQKADPSRS